MLLWGLKNVENILQVLNNQNYKQWCGIISYPLAWKLCGKAKLTSLYSQGVNFFFNSHSHQQESLLKVLSVIACIENYPHKPVYSISKFWGHE